MRPPSLCVCMRACWGRDVANRKGLRLVGWAYGAVTILVALMALVVVNAEIKGPMQARASTDAMFARLSK